MKTPFLLLPSVAGVCALLGLSHCTTAPRPGDVISERIYMYNGKRYFEQRTLLTQTPYEVELKTRQIPR
jgi:hypothetical protein